MKVRTVDPKSVLAAQRRPLDLLRRVARHLHEESAGDKIAHVLAGMVDEYLACPEAPPGPTSAMLDEHDKLVAIEGKLDAAVVKAQAAFDANRKAIDELWQRIESTKGGVE